MSVCSFSAFAGGLSIEPLQPVQPRTKLLELRQQFLFYLRRHSSRPREEAEHVGIALLRSGKGLVGVFPVAQAILGLGKAGQGKAHI